MGSTWAKCSGLHTPFHSHVVWNLTLHDAPGEERSKLLSLEEGGEKKMKAKVFFVASISNSVIYSLVDTSHVGFT